MRCRRILGEKSHNVFSRHTINKHMRWTPLSSVARSFFIGGDARLLGDGVSSIVSDAQNLLVKHAASAHARLARLVAGDMHVTQVRSSAQAQSIAAAQSDYDYLCDKWREFIFSGGGSTATVRREDVYGVDEIAKKIAEHAGALKHYQGLMQFDPPPELSSGILLKGRPGIGKTYLASFLATESEACFVNIMQFPYFGKDGPTQLAIRALFDVARAYVHETNQPIVLFWDNIDKFTIDRNLSFEDVARAEAIVELTHQLSGVGLRRDGILMVATTNTESHIPDDLLRKGRLGDHYSVPHPDRRGRERHLRNCVGKKSHAADIDYENISYLFLPDTTPADIEEFVKSAYRIACQRRLNHGEARITEEILIETLLLDILGHPVARYQTKKQLLDTATHEMGHAVVARELGIKVPLVTIISTTNAYGYIRISEVEDRHVTIQDILNRITGMYGGRLGEELCGIFGTVGMENDLRMASDDALRLVENLGLGVFQASYSAYGIFKAREGLFKSGFISDGLTRIVEQEVEKICLEQRERARRILDAFGAERLKWLANQLVENKQYLLEKELDDLIAEAKKKFDGPEHLLLR